MRGCGHIITRSAAVLLAAAFAVTLPLSLVAFNLGRVAFSPERMTVLLLETIEETGGLRQLVIESLAAESATGEAQGLDLAEALSFLSPQERDYLGEQLTPPGWAREQLGALVAGVYTWIDDDRARPSFVVDITDLKVALLSGAAADLVETVVDSWPPCSVEDIAEMTVGALLGEDSLRLCEPPEPLRSGVVGLLNASVTLSLRALPDRISLSESDNAPASPEVLETKETIRQVRFLAGWSWLLSLVMLGLVMALAIRSWRGVALWWGGPLVVGALLTLATMVAVRVGVEGLARRALSDASTSPWIGEVIHTLVTAMLVVVFRRVALQAAILAATGVVLLVAGLLIHRSASRRAAPPSSSPSEAGTLRFAPEATPPEADEPGEPGDTPSGMFG
jgi:hypothetical protein